MALRDRAEHGRQLLDRCRRFLDRNLFAGPAPAPTGPAGWKKAGPIVAFLALAVVLQLARIGWTGSLDSLWAEDGPIFLQSAATEGFFHTLGSTYSGYLVLVPRLIAELATLVPLADAAAAISILSAIVVGLSGLVVWYAAADYIRNPYLRGALVLMTVLTPVGGLETIDSAAYVSWYMLFASFWILLWRPRTGAGAAGGALFVAATMLSNPSALFFLPLALLRALAIRGRRDRAIVGAYFGSLVVQLAAMVLSSGETVEPGLTKRIGTDFLQRVVDGAALGLRLGGHAWELLGWPFLIVLTLGVAVAFALGIRHSDGRGRTFAALALATAVVTFVVSVYLRGVGTLMLWPGGGFGAQAGRYAIVPVLLVVSAAMVVLERQREEKPAPFRAWLPLALLALLLVSTGASYSAADVAQRGTPPWRDALDAAAATCAGEPGEETIVVTSPPGFKMRLPCSQLP